MKHATPAHGGLSKQSHRYATMRDSFTEQEKATESKLSRYTSRRNNCY